MDPMDIMKNLQNLQSQMSGMQEQLQDITAQGSAGGGMVTVEMNGKMDVLSVHIAQEVVDPDEVGMLEDLVLAAISSAMGAIKEKIASEASSLAGGAGFPGGFPQF
ncbi:MAG: YbaB/EbfC family nucleoid-associated protein [Spirochaetales bacterium]|jgi:DNA-binding YbaB/EbfC family protein|nr:YbaB/EbfC family nucleoid-associated protein [Spirochaetales bacterium]